MYFALEMWQIQRVVINWLTFISIKRETYYNKLWCEVKNDHLTHPFCKFGFNILGLLKVWYSGYSLAFYQVEFGVRHFELGSFIKFQSLQSCRAIECDQDDRSKAIKCLATGPFFHGRIK